MRDLERELHELQRRFGDVQRMADLGSWEWDIPRDRITWTEGLYRIFGQTPESFEATYEAYLECIHPDDREMVHRTVEQAFERRRPYSMDHRLVRPGGAVRWVHSSGDVEVDEDGEPVRLHGIAVDITDRKHAEDLLRQFITTAAHELRTPVATISHATELLSFGEPAGAERDEILAVLGSQGRRLRTLSENLLDVATVEQGPNSVILGSVELDKALDGALSEAPPPEGLELEIRVPDGLAVRADPPQLQRVLINLLTNIYDHGGDHAWITAERDGFEVSLEVADDGPGVPADLVGDLFAPFRAGRGDTEGPGLGLAVVRTLMAGFGGTIDHHRRDPRGARFVARFGQAS